MANGEESRPSAAESAGVTETDALRNGVKLIGESMLPGASLLMDGQVGRGALHVAAGFVGRALLGPPGWILVAANSYSKSVTHKNLYQHLRKQPSAGEQG